MPANQVPDLQQPSTSSGRTQAVENKRSKRKSASKDDGNQSKRRKEEWTTENGFKKVGKRPGSAHGSEESESDQNRANKAEDKQQNTLDEAADADETQRDDNEAAEDAEVEILAEVPGNQTQTGHIQAEFNGGQEDNQANGRDLTPEEIEKIKHPMGRNATWQTRSIKANIGNQERKEARNKKLNLAYNLPHRAWARLFISVS